MNVRLLGADREKNLGGEGGCTSKEGITVSIFCHSSVYFISPSKFVLVSVRNCPNNLTLPYEGLSGVL